ncbi:MAG: primosomal protein N' [Bacteroidales bacterium]|nr:primosomal protein N' [Bacteroidales bacterium]MCF8336802.1 primosomal protein N' [Bacteroidales bacterium]
MESFDKQILFVEVLLPLPVKGVFTYRVPWKQKDRVVKGIRVVVQFGRKKIYTGLVIDIHSNIPQNFQPKYIQSILDPTPVVNEVQLKFWDWLADYYLSYTGEVMNAAMPSALKLASESKIVLHPSFEKDYSNFNEKEYLIIEALEIQGVLTLSEVSKIMEQTKILPVIKNLIEKKAVLMQEEVKDTYKPKKEKYVSLKEAYLNEQSLSELFDELNKKAYKQLELLMAYIKLSDFYSEESKEAVRQSALLHDANASHAQIKALENKGIVEVFEKEESRLASHKSSATTESIKLTPEQEQTLREIKNHFEEKNSVLLHGVTGSGKTEIYIKLIREAIDQGKQVLYLLPEIALTGQIINRLRRFFGDRVGIYHSKYNPFERVEIWNTVLNNHENREGKYQVVVGARSALFLPFSNLGLIIVDEEHDTSYKQFDPAPRYHARDAAVYLATLHKAKVLMGTATPSLETYYNTQQGKYGLVELNTRYGGLQLPELQVSNLKEEKRKKKMRSMFSSLLLKNMESALENNEQVILFQNRRGFSLRVECEVCSWIPECRHCDVTLIYHKKSNLLKCHYCGYTEHVPNRCPSCGSQDIFMKGFGTEQVEEELALMYPNQNIKRMDLDTTRSKHGHQRIINDFEARRIDILVGTQMVTKGLDFDNVSVVGILSADGFLSFPDFRAFERGFQLIAQVSGRAGRKKKRGKVIIQAHNPWHDAIRFALDNDYLSMYKSQILERKNFKYPPFYRIVRIDLRHKEVEKLNKGAFELGKNLKHTFGQNVLGPEFPVVPRIRNYYIKQIMVKIPKGKKLAETKKQLYQKIEEFRDNSSYKSIRLAIDVDPL